MKITQTELNKSRRIKIPSKAFVLGEYAVLCGAPAMVATFDPCFEISFSKVGQNNGFHPESPAGQWVEKSESSSVFQFNDPFTGHGGFGGSTAEFLGVWSLLRKPIKDLEEENSVKAWNDFRSLFFQKDLVPSGADLVAQASGGVISWDPETRAAKQIGDQVLWNDLLVFSATHKENRKVKSHQHLQGLGSPETLLESGLLVQLRKIFDEGMASLLNEDSVRFGRSLTAYGDALAGFKLEHPDAGLEKKAFLKIEGVLGAKGSGALQSDTILVLIDENENTFTEVSKVAEKLDLKLVTRGVGKTKGAFHDSM